MIIFDSHLLFDNQIRKIITNYFCLNAKKLSQNLKKRGLCHLSCQDFNFAMKNSRKYHGCEVFGCQNYASHNQDFASGERIRFHYFPRDIER